ncbi:MAG: ABC transporter permease [Candidatus Sumerlaeia bacterium]|nr:ABC transporter permease [Candidatus Sumerlaeia bacterium]
MNVSSSHFWRARWIGRFGLPGKEAVHFARVPLAVGGVAVVGLLATQIVHHYHPGPVDPGVAGLDIFSVAVLAMAYILGLTMVGEEIEHGTDAFLLRLPVAPSAILWAKLLAGFLMLGAGALVLAMALGTLLSSGMGLGRFIVECVPAAGKRLEALLLIVSLFFGGMAAGAWVTRSTVAAAVVGAVAQALWWLMVLTVASTHLGIDSYQAHTRGLSSIAHASWAALMLGALVAKMRVWGEPDAGLWRRWRTSLAERWRARSLRLPGPRLLPAALVTAAICSAIAGALAHYTPTSQMGDVLPMKFSLLAVLLLAGTVLGSGALAPGEREQTTFFLHQLPVEPWRFHRNRLRRLVFAAFFVGFAASFACVVVLGTVRGFPLTYEGWKILGCGTIACACSSMLAYWVRFFQRSRIVTIVIASLVAVAWSFALALVVMFHATAAELSVVAFIVEIVWPLLLVMGLPPLLVLLTVRGTLLLEAGESVRTLAMLAAVPLALVWGPFLIGLSPVDLLTILFG